MIRCTFHRRERGSDRHARRYAQAMAELPDFAEWCRIYRVELRLADRDRQWRLSQGMPYAGWRAFWVPTRALLRIQTAAQYRRGQASNHHCHDHLDLIATLRGLGLVR